jgi:CO/xanthine dehydrogenase Mo-binding subunit
MGKEPLRRDVYHATGVRVRDLPVRIEDLLGSSPLSGV